MIFGSPQQRNVDPEMDYGTAFDNARRVFESLLTTLEDSGVVLCMEPLAPNETNFCSTVAATVELIEDFDHPNLKLILDTKAMIDELKGRHILPKIIAWAAPIGAQLLGAANLAVALGYQVAMASVILESALVYMLWISIAYFISLLKQEQKTT